MNMKPPSYSQSVKSPINQSSNRVRRWESTFGKSLPRAGIAIVLVSAVLDEPLKVSAGVDYVVSIESYWWEVAVQNRHTKPIVNGHITALSTVYGPPGSCPTTVNPHLRFRDVVFEPDGVEASCTVGVKAVNK